MNPTVLLRRPIVELALQLQAAGHEVGILTPRGTGATHRRESERLLAAQPAITLHYLPSYEIKSVLWSFPTQLRFLSKISAILGQYDIAHVWAPYYLISLAPLWLKYRRKLAHTNLILTFDTFPGFSFTLEPRWLNSIMRAYTLLARRLFNYADRITLYSDLLCPYATQLKLPVGKIAVLPTGVHVSATPDLASARPAAQGALGIPEGTVAVLFAGLLNARKGIETLLRVIAATKDTALYFIIVGDGPLRARIEKFLRDNKLTHKAQVAGAQQQMKKFYAAADIFFLPSQGEGLPGVVMEAMSWQLPIVASDIPCIPDLVVADVNGYVCSPTDTDSFAHSLRQLEKDAALRHRLGAAGRERIQQFAWTHIFPRYLALYATLAAS